MRQFRFVLLTVISLFFFCAALSAQTTVNNYTQSTLRAKAVFDDCWTGLGANLPYQKPPCAQGQIPKVNGGYIWSMVDTGDDIWFGTVANPLCTTQGAVSQGDYGTTPYKTPAYACEYGVSPYVPPLTDPVGDYRPPQMFVYNKASKALTEITPKARVTQNNPLGLDDTLRRTVGIRAATKVGNHVIFAGPSLTGGINMFAFRIDNKAWIAKTTLLSYLNIRDFVTYNGVVYTGVRNTLGGGSVLKYVGSIPDTTPPPPPRAPEDCSTCFRFVSVGDLDSEAANLAIHEGRLYTSTWPNANGAMAGVWMSPVIPDGGLTRSNSTGWLRVWKADDYEPDSVIATSYGGGALASFGGYLYWGTIHVPYASVYAYIGVYGNPANQDELETIITKSWRTLALFRGRNFDTTPEVSLLYGSQKLNVYVPGSPGTWVLTSNKMGGVKGLYGGSGFNNPLNVYTWQMANWDNKLWISTFDWSYLGYLSQNIETLPSAAGRLKLTAPAPAPTADSSSVYGADLYYFKDSTSAAIADSTTGLGNYASYGVRRLTPTSTSMFAGMANPMNLLTDPAAALPLGGWELLELVPKTVPPPPAAKQ